MGVQWLEERVSKTVELYTQVFEQHLEDFPHRILRELGDSLASVKKYSSDLPDDYPSLLQACFRSHSLLRQHVQGLKSLSTTSDFVSDKLWKEIWEFAEFLDNEQECLFELVEDQIEAELDQICLA